ncbi:uncharacterized protein LOC107791689 [Nicotiana tabacum]|uniref:Uncharacterized protein LOC107791689 n=1 Tax=Nicotiana tabacum TaxID=4097 RepID=A0A1S3ZXU8_TOBAC|nr:PREDICTED: uncharacterized protein LOC107791689 [Nicotiana tabacum]
MDHQPLRDDFTFTSMASVAAEGHSSGIVVLWDENILLVEEIAITNQEVHCMVEVLYLTRKFLFSSIYASPTLAHRQILWQNLKCISDNYHGPWLVGGDFNEVTRASEKFGGRHLNNKHVDQFLNCLNYCNLVDLGFKGSRFTWSNNRSNSATILERLDMVVANYGWINLFPNTLVRHLPRSHSDHCPLLLTPPTAITNKPFHFESIWTSHPGFHHPFSHVWHDNNDSLLPAITNFQTEVHDWNKNTFGNIFEKKCILLARLSGLQKSPHYPTSNFLHHLEADLICEFNNLLKLEEYFWTLKSRIQWLNNGDANTRFFHLTTLQRRKRNRITTL